MSEQVNDMLEEITEWLVADPELSALKELGALKSYERPESLAQNATSVVIVPMGPPQQATMASNKSLAKQFVYQINVEAADKKTVIQLQWKIELILMSHGFYQEPGGLDEYFKATQRYVDARRYVGHSELYKKY